MELFLHHRRVLSTKNRRTELLTRGGAETEWYDFPYYLIKKLMKGVIRNSNSPQYNKHKKPAENKDNLDSRENEEYQSKGDDITHNRKDQHNKPSGKKKHK